MRKTLLYSMEILFISLGSIHTFAQSPSSAELTPNSDKTERSSPDPTLTQDAKAITCTYAKEYITTLEYLRDHKNFAVPENEARKLAEQVSKGCTGAAGRFIQVNSLLSQAELSANNSIETAMAFTTKSDSDTEAFISIFSKAYLADGLDLDVRTSLKMANSLFTDFHGDAKITRKDFEKLIQFCIEPKNLDLPKPECARLASRVTQLSERFKNGAADSFIQIYSFLRSEAGPNLITGQALELSEKIVQKGENSTENFIQSYKYSVSPKGLNRSIQESIQFAKKLTLQQNSEG